MTGFEFSPAMRLALDAYRVPPLPEGFAERVVARALAESRQRAPSAARTARWRRPRRIFAGVLLAGLLSATAAAAGWLGKPVYVPVISELIERVKPAENHLAKSRALSRPAAAPAVPASPEPIEAPVDLAPAPVPARPSMPDPALSPATAPTAVPAPVAIERAIVAPAPDQVERAELRREALSLAPQRTADAVPLAERPTLARRIEPDQVAAVEPAVRPTPGPVRPAEPILREVRPAERLRPPVQPRPVGTAPRTVERRQQMRERRIP